MVLFGKDLPGLEERRLCFIRATASSTVSLRGRNGLAKQVVKRQRNELKVLHNITISNLLRALVL